MGKFALIQNGSNTAIRNYLTSAAGLALWSYHQTYKIWISKRELTSREIADVRATGGGHTVIPVSRVVSSVK